MTHRRKQNWMTNKRFPSNQTPKIKDEHFNLLNNPTWKLQLPFSFIVRMFDTNINGTLHVEIDVVNLYGNQVS